MRIEDKIKEIEKYLEEIMNFIPDSFEEYEKDAKTKSACERHFEKIIEAVIDLAFIIIKSKKWEVPEDDSNALDIIVNKKIISSDLSEKLRDAKGMRNFIIHQYGKIDDFKVFTAIKEELEKDIEDLIKQVENNLKK